MSQLCSHLIDRPSTALKVDKKKTAHTFGCICMRYIYTKPKENASTYSNFQMKCRSSSMRNKAKRFLNMSVAICNEPKIGIIQQKTFNVSCLFCKTIHFYSFEQRNIPSNVFSFEKVTKDFRNFLEVFIGQLQIKIKYNRVNFD